MAVLLLVVSLGFVVRHAQIPPVVDSDYCYQLLAAKRLLAGQGLTSIPPAAPMQPWIWRADFAFLTQWPVGYALLVAGVASAFNVAVIKACGFISIAACALALVGWFLWVRRCTSTTVTGTLIAAVAAGCAVSAASLINPSTDALLMALIPYVLLCAGCAVERSRGGGHGEPAAPIVAWFIATGLAAGSLVWFRYASVFVPCAIGLAFIIEWRFRQSLRFAHVACFAVAAFLPMAILLFINRSYGLNGTTQQQLNLGASLGFDFSPSLLAEVWLRFTDLGFYDHHASSHWAFALWPAMLVVIVLSVAPARRAVITFLARTEVTISALVVGCLLVMLLVATVLFSGKFNYVGLDRYYLPARPLYFALFVSPLLLVRARLLRVMVLRAILCAGLLVAASWTLNQQWPRPLLRWQAEGRASTPMGQTALCFEPNAGELYRWIAAQAGDDLIVVSNFHEYVALETALPALPVPPNRTELDRWIERICLARTITNPKVLFVLNPDNKWRGYWIDDPPQIRRSFELDAWPDAPPGLSGLVFKYARTRS